MLISLDGLTGGDAGDAAVHPATEAATSEAGDGVGSARGDAASGETGADGKGALTADALPGLDAQEAHEASAEAEADVLAEAGAETGPDATLDDTGADAAADTGPDAASRDAAAETGAVVPLRYVQGTASDYGSTGAATLSFARAVGAGDAIVVAVDFDSNSAPAVTDSLGNVFSVVASGSISNSGMYIALAQNIAGGEDAVTVSIDTPSATYFEFYQYEYAGLALSGAFDAASSATGMSSSLDAMSGGPVTTSAAGDLIFGYGITGEAAAGTGFTVRSNFNSNIVEDQVAGAPGVYTATATMVSGTSWQMITAAFRTQ
jgi:hypothetical protein